MKRTIGVILATLLCATALLASHAYVYSRGYTRGSDTMAELWLNACTRGTLIQISKDTAVYCAPAKKPSE